MNGNACLSSIVLCMCLIKYLVFLSLGEEELWDSNEMM